MASPVNMNMKKKSMIISLTILILLAVLELLIGLQIWQLNIVPLKYFLLIFAAVFLFDLLIARLLLCGKKKRIIWRRALGYILSVIVVVLLFIVSQGLSKIQQVNYDTLFAMIDALCAEQADALLINSAYVDIITEVDTYTDFSEKVKCIWQYDVHQIVEPETVEEQPQAVPEETSDYAPFVVYISGSDTRSKKLKTSRSDVNILAVINPQTEQILLINTPRDYYIPNPAGNGVHYYAI